MEPTPRRAARLLVIDPISGAVLLFQYEDGGRRWWATPGGALDGDETFEEAAIREATEELAISSRRFLPLWRAGPSSFYSAAPLSAKKSSISCFGSLRATWLSDTRCERLTVRRTSSRRGGGHSRTSRRPANKSFPKTWRSACASWVNRDKCFHHALLGMPCCNTPSPPRLPENSIPIAKANFEKGGDDAPRRTLCTVQNAR
jgi:hypothetical protein